MKIRMLGNHQGTSGRAVHMYYDGMIYDTLSPIDDTFIPFSNAELFLSRIQAELVEP